MAKTRAQENRAIRQDALRQQLASQKHVEKVFEITEELAKPDIEPKDVQRLKVKAEIHMKLVDKYLPSLKAMELSGDSANPVSHKWSVEFINATSESKS